MKIIKSFLLILLLSTQALYASERIDSIVYADTYASLEGISKQKNEIQEKKDYLQKMQASLKQAKKGQATYVKIRNIAGTLAIIAIAIGAYKTTFPSGVKFTGLKLMLSSYIAVSGLGQGMIKLSQTDIQNLSREIIRSLISISKLEKGIDRQVFILCKQESRHELCYTIKN
jgi:hypothetical protein